MRRQAVCHPEGVDAASVASDWYTLQELRLADPASDGGLGCPDGEYLLSADALACPHDAERASGIAYLCLLTSRGSFFVLAYNVKECPRHHLPQADSRAARGILSCYWGWGWGWGWGW